MPKWIWEGVAVYTSGELMKKEKLVKFSKFLEYYKKHDKNIYEDSGFVVGLLIQKFGKQKFLELLTRLTEATTENEFSKLFSSIYGIKLSYDEINKL